MTVEIDVGCFERAADAKLRSLAEAALALGGTISLEGAAVAKAEAEGMIDVGIGPGTDNGTDSLGIDVPAGAAPVSAASTTAETIALVNTEWCMFNVL